MWYFEIAKSFQVAIFYFPNKMISLGTGLVSLLYLSPIPKCPQICGLWEVQR